MAVVQSPEVTAPGPDAHTRRSWRSVVFSPLGDGQRRRRGSDALRIGASVAIVLLGVVIGAANSHLELSISKALHPPPQGISWLVTTVDFAGTLGTIGALSLLAVLARRWRLARDMVLAAAVALLLTVIIHVLFGGNAGRPQVSAVRGLGLGFPVARVAIAIAVACVALPYLSRSLQRLVELAIAVSALASLVRGDALFFDVLSSVALGWGSAAVVHLSLGSPLGLPSVAEVRDLLVELGVTATEVRASGRQVWGVAAYVGTHEDGKRLDISFYGRDAADAQLMAKLWRFLFFKGTGGFLAFTRIQQVEHEAYLTLLAARSLERRAPVVCAAGAAGPSRDAILASIPPAAVRLEELDDTDVLDAAALCGYFRDLGALRRARISHGGISPSTVVVAPGGGGLIDFHAARAAADADQLDRDTADLLATLATAVGAEQTVAAAAATLPKDVLSAALPYLQRAALNAEAARALKGRKELLGELRTAGAAAAGVEVPKLIEAKRVSWSTLVLVIGTLIGGWALIGVLINVSNSFSTIVGASWGWVAVTFVLAQAVFAANALTVVGSVLDPLPYGLAVALEVSNSFSSLAAGSVGTLGTRVRFFQRQGYDATLAVSSGVLVATASWIVKGLLFLVSLPFALGALHFDHSPAAGSSRTVWLILVIVLGVSLLAGVALLIPRIRSLARQKVVPRVADSWAHLRLLAQHPRKLAAVVGGCLAAQLLVDLALGASLHAFGERLSLPVIIVVITLASIVGGASPVPGGMGVVEAGLILGLTAAGVAEQNAVAAVFVQRLFTSYLPPIWGWCTLVWMRRREYL